MEMSHSLEEILLDLSCLQLRLQQDHLPLRVHNGARVQHHIQGPKPLETATLELLVVLLVAAVNQPPTV